MKSSVLCFKVSVEWLRLWLWLSVSIFKSLVAKTCGGRVFGKHKCGANCSCDISSLKHFTRCLHGQPYFFSLHLAGEEWDVCVFLAELGV